MAALHPHVRRPGRGAADHRQRRRLLPDRHRRQALPRRAGRPVRRPDRLRLRRRDRRGRARADARAALLHELELRPPARDRARRGGRQLAPGDLNRVFFVSGGSEAVESAWKLARQWHAAHGERRWKAVSRNVAYHGTTMGALSINGIGDAAHAVRAARPRGRPLPQHQPLPPPGGGDGGGVHRLPARRPRAHARGARPDHGRDGDHGAGPERRRRLRPAQGLLPGRPRRSATSTASCCAPTRSSTASAASAAGSARRSTTSSRT